MWSAGDRLPALKRQPMKGVFELLYTSYVSKIKGMPENFVKVLIMRKPFPFLEKMIEKEEVIWCPELAPSEELWLEYISETGERDFSKYLTEIRKNEKAQDTIHEIKSGLAKGVTIALICCEKEIKICHRGSLAEEIGGGIEWGL